MGGSTNTVLHALAVAVEAGVPFDLQHLNEVAERVPHVCKVAPSGIHHMEDVDRAGGVPAILKTIAKKPGTLNLDCITVTGKTLGENIADAEVKDPEVIRPARPRLLAERRVGDSLRQSGPQRVGHQGGGSNTRHDAIQRPGGHL